ncbi:MAG: hypothetical protein ACLQOO_10040 [Terriglobia bacterium]
MLLGTTQPEGLPLDLFTSGKALWLGVQPQLPGAVEQPRVLLVAVPYALKASDSDTLGGKPASAYALAGAQALLAVPTGTSSSSFGSSAGAQSIWPSGPSDGEPPPPKGREQPRIVNPRQCGKMPHFFAFSVSVTPCAILSC